MGGSKEIRKPTAEASDACRTRAARARRGGATQLLPTGAARLIKTRVSIFAGFFSSSLSPACGIRERVSLVPGRRAKHTSLPAAVSYRTSAPRYARQI